MAGTSADLEERPSRAGVHHRRRRWRRRYRRQLRRRILMAFFLLLGAVLILLVLSIPSALGARDHLAKAGAAMLEGKHLLLRGDEDALGAFERADAEFLAAQGDVDNPAIRILGVLPVVGRSPDTASNLVDAGLRSAQAGVIIATALEDLPGGFSALAPRDGRIPLKPLRDLAGPLGRADRLLLEARRVLARSPGSFLLPTVAEAVEEFQPSLEKDQRGIHSAASLMRVLPEFLGAGGTRRYIIAVQNPAESRGTGGLIGVYSILTVRDGALSMSSFGDVAALPTVPEGSVRPPNESYATRYGRFQALSNWSNVNMTPDFPSAATALERMYREVAGTRVEGTIAVDPHAFEEFLRVLGAVEIPETGFVLDASNVVDYLTNQAYADLPDAGARKSLLGQAAAQVLGSFLVGVVDVPGDVPGRERPDEKVGSAGSTTQPSRSPASPAAPTEPDASPGAQGQPATGQRQAAQRPAGRLGPTVALGRAMVEAASGGHILIHAVDREVQGAFQAPGVTAPLAQSGAGDYLAVVGNNASGNKIDFYLDRSIRYEVVLGAEGAATGEATIRLENGAPRSGQPAYVIGPFDERFRAGQNRSLISAYCAPTCLLNGFTRDGRPDFVGSEVELGYPVYSVFADMPSGGEEVLTYAWNVEEAWLGDTVGGTYRLEFHGQPTIRPTRLTIDLRVPEGMEVTSTTPGMDVEGGRAVWSGRAPDRMVLAVSFERPLLPGLWHRFLNFLNQPVIQLGVIPALVPVGGIGRPRGRRSIRT